MALDEKGITLAEVNKKYPRTVQTLGYDVVLDYDAAHKPKVISSFEMCINIILTLLFMKPGQYPSIPDLGIDIEQYLHEYSDNKGIPNIITNKLNEQCNRLGVTGITFDCSFDMLEGINVLVIQINGTERMAIGSESNKVILGISYDKLNKVYSKKVYIK